MNLEERLQAFEQQLDVLGGELMGMQVAINALITCHPNTTAARQAALQALDKLISQTLTTNDASDPLVLGLQSTKEILALPY